MDTFRKIGKETLAVILGGTGNKNRTDDNAPPHESLQTLRRMIDEEIRAARAEHLSRIHAAAASASVRRGSWSQRVSPRAQAESRAQQIPEVATRLRIPAVA